MKPIVKTTQYTHTFEIYYTAFFSLPADASLNDIIDVESKRVIESLHNSTVNYTIPEYEFEINIDMAEIYSDGGPHNNDEGLHYDWKVDYKILGLATEDMDFDKVKTILQNDDRLVLAHVSSNFHADIDKMTDATIEYLWTADRDDPLYFKRTFKYQMFEKGLTYEDYIKSLKTSESEFDDL